MFKGIYRTLSKLDMSYEVSVGSYFDLFQVLLSGIQKPFIKPEIHRLKTR